MWTRPVPPLEGAGRGGVRRHDSSPRCLKTQLRASGRAVYRFAALLTTLVPPTRALCSPLRCLTDSTKLNSLMTSLGGSTRYQELVQLCPEVEEYKIYHAQSLYKVRVCVCFSQTTHKLSSLRQPRAPTTSPLGCVFSDDTSRELGLNRARVPHAVCPGGGVSGGVGGRERRARVRPAHDQVAGCRGLRAGQHQPYAPSYPYPYPPVLTGLLDCNMRSSRASDSTRAPEYLSCLALERAFLPTQAKRPRVLHF